MEHKAEGRHLRNILTAKRLGYISTILSIPRNALQSRHLGSNQVRLLFGIEHESNGIGNEQSRSLNCATVACLYEPLENWRFGARAWYGYFYDNEDIYQGYFNYRGIMQLWGTFHTRNERLQVTALVNPTINFTKYNVQLEASWRLAKRSDWLPSLFVQYCYGYGETMIDYNQRSSKIRIGISLVNNKLNLY